MAITTIEELEAIYGRPELSSTAKVADHLTAQYAAFIRRAPFVALATAGPDGLDCSPRGDRPDELVRIVDQHTLMMPDRRGNNRIDSLRNIVADPRVGLFFLIPGIGNTIRLNGRATITTDADVLQSFAVSGKPPRSVIVVAIDAVYFQCARAIIRAGLWKPESLVDPASLPTPGEILAEMSNGKVGGAYYDRIWPERAAASLW